MPEFAGKRGWRDSQNRALGVGDAVAAHFRKCHPAYRAPPASAHDQDIGGAAGKVHQDPPCGASLYVRLYQWIVGDLAPHCDERLVELVAGMVPAFLTEVAGWLGALSAFAAGRLPGNDRDQDRIVGAGQDLPVAQCPHAAR
jgi:hypothetical protein